MWSFLTTALHYRCKSRKDYQTEEETVGYYNTGDRMMAWGKTGAFWGSIWGLMFGSAFFLLPGVGPLLAAGPLVGWIVGALEGAVMGGGLSALGAGLFGIGIPENSVIQYETHIKAGKFVVIAHGSFDEVSKIRGVLDSTPHQGLAAHTLSGPDRARPSPVSRGSTRPET